MKKPFRIEYLVPSIADLRKYEFLENAVLKPAIAKSHIEIKREVFKNREIGLTNTDYFTFYQVKDQSNLFLSEFLKTHEEKFEVFRMNPHRVWNDEILNKLAKFLVKNPTAIPYFLDHQCIAITGLLLGKYDLYESVHNVGNYEPKYAFSKERENKEEFAWIVQIAKHKLSLLLAVVDRLIALGINVDEYNFRNLENCTTFKDLQTAGHWTETIKDYIPEDGFQRIDGLTVSKDELVSLLSFNNFSEFLASISKLARMAHLRVYCEETMMNPRKIVPIAIKQADSEKQPIESINDPYANVYPEENKINIIECCRIFQNKLAQMQLEVNYRVLSRKLEDLREEIRFANGIENFDWSSLNFRFQTIYDEIKLLPENIQTELLENIARLAKQGQIDIKIAQPQSLEARVATLESTVEEHSERIRQAETRITNLEEAIGSLYDYIDKGTPIPQEVLKYINKTHISKLAFYPTKTKSATLRKGLIVGALLIGSLPLLISSSVKIEEPAQENITPSIAVSIKEEPNIGEAIEEPAKPIEVEEKGMKLYTEITGIKNCYESVYDKKPQGTTEKKGIIIRYYALQEDGTCCAMLETEKELEEFIKEHGEGIRSFTWKAAICTQKDAPLRGFIEKGEPVPWTFTTFFTDYTPSLDFNFDYTEPTM